MLTVLRISHRHSPSSYTPISAVSFTLSRLFSSSIIRGAKAKKGEAPTEEAYFGRPGNSLKMGLVGLPNVGKSTLFNLMTKMQVPAENFPFCTIDPSESRCEIPDERYEWLCQHFNPKSRVPTFLQVTDIAGLVKGAHDGAGLGNSFLSHIKAVDGIFHVTRTFDDEDVSHVENSIDPVRDLEIISEELRKKDISQAKKESEGLVRHAKTDREKKAALDVLTKAISVLEEGTEIRNAQWNANEINSLNHHSFLTAKPAVFLLNMSPDEYIARSESKWLQKISDWVDTKGGGIVIPFSAAVEDAIEFGESSEPSALESIIKTGYQSLNLIHYFTCGPDEVRCWTVRKGSTAPQAAGRIHTDFEKNFHSADVTPFDDLKELGSEAKCKSEGRTRQQGKTYIVQDGDIMLFKMAQGGKKK